MLISEFQVVVDPPEIKAKINSQVSFTCTVEPLILLETVSISWTKSSTFLTSMRTLKFANLKRSDAGEYVCTGENGGITSQGVGKISIIECDTSTEFTCSSDGSCIQSFRRCDKVQDCPNNEDETNCRKNSENYLKKNCQNRMFFSVSIAGF